MGLVSFGHSLDQLVDTKARMQEHWGGYSSDRRVRLMGDLVPSPDPVLNLWDHKSLVYFDSVLGIQ